MDFEKMYYELLSTMQESLGQQAQTIEQLNQTIQQLNETIAELTEKLNKNSRNSSKPPSSDGLRKPPAQRKPSGKKKGGQPGHSGSHLSITAEPDEFVQHLPAPCQSCPNAAACLEVSGSIHERRHVIDMVVKTSVEEHQLITVQECPCGHGQLRGAFPPGVSATVQYGENLRALAVALNTIGMVSVGRTHDILSDMWGVPISTGTIMGMVKSCAACVSGTVDVIRDRVQEAAVAHFDESGTRLDGHGVWMHNSSTGQYTYLTIHANRGKKGMDANGVLPGFHGIAVHDFWPHYFQFTDATHAVCNAHLLRELNAVIENKPEQTWAKEMKELLLEMKRVVDKALRDGKPALSTYYLRKFDRSYLDIVHRAVEQNPMPERPPDKKGRPKKGKIRALVDRFAQYRASVCLFTKNFAVPFDNNQAERDIRMLKVNTKVSGCFRSQDGADDFAKIMSYLGTAKKHNVNCFRAIVLALRGQAPLVLA